MGERQAKVGDPDLLPDGLEHRSEVVLVGRDRAENSLSARRNV